jgi:hypothetical protein
MIGDRYLDHVSQGSYPAPTGTGEAREFDGRAYYADKLQEYFTRLDAGENVTLAGVLHEQS